MYIGYAPYDDPQISIAVAIENAGGGGSNAAPLARNVMDFYFESQPDGGPSEIVIIENASGNEVQHGVNSLSEQ